MIWCIHDSSISGNSGFPHADLMAKLFADVGIQHREQSRVRRIAGKTRNTDDRWELKETAQCVS
jgi:hypothetical protein